LFFRKVSPTEIESMSYQSLKYWNNWHDLMIEAEKKEIERIKNKRK